MATVLQRMHTQRREAHGNGLRATLAIFRKALYDSRKTMLWLAVGLGLYVLTLMSFYPTMTKDAAKFDELIQSYPKSLMSMFYQGDITDFSIANPGNFIQTEFMSWLLLIVGAIGIGQVFNAFTNAERDGSMDMFLSLPVSRRSYLVGRVLNTALMILVVLTSMFLAFWIASLIWSQFDPNIGRLALGIYGGFWPLMVIISFAYLLAAVVPSSKRFAGPVVYLFMIGSYLIYGFSGSVKTLSDIRPVFLYYYYNAADIINHGVNLGDWGILAGVSLVYLVLAWWLVDKKELGV
jgi:ABC-type transport system involved in multi-copper enzyme maturation permease subunit